MQVAEVQLLVLEFFRASFLNLLETPLKKESSCSLEVPSSKPDLWEVLIIHFSLYSYISKKIIILCRNLPCAWIIKFMIRLDALFEKINTIYLKSTIMTEQIVSYSIIFLSGLESHKTGSWIDCCALLVCLFVACPVIILNLHDCHALYLLFAPFSFTMVFFVHSL